MYRMISTSLIITYSLIFTIISIKLIIIIRDDIFLYLFNILKAELIIIVIIIILDYILIAEALIWEQFWVQLFDILIIKEIIPKRVFPFLVIWLDFTSRCVMCWVIILLLGAFGVSVIAFGRLFEGILFSRAEELLKILLIEWLDL